MKTYKLIDFWMQVLLIAGGIVYSFTVTEGIFHAYFIVGGFQLLSCLIHFLCAGHFLPVKDRRAYLKTLLWILIIGVISIPIWFFFLCPMLFASPILALWYAIICYQELDLMNRKALIHLR